MMSDFDTAIAASAGPETIRSPAAPTGITVHTMGVHYKWQIPDVVRQQLRLAHNLREDLVSLQLAYDEDIKAIWSSYSAVAAAETEVAAAEARAVAANEAVKAARSVVGGKRVDEALTARLREARAVLKSARQARRDAIAGVREAATQRRRERAAQLAADQKALYGTYCQRGEPTLFWATFNSVVDEHRAAVRRIQRQRAQGRPATLRHHRFDGTGTLAVQLQRTTGAPARTPAVLADPAGRYHNVLQLPWIAPERWAAMSRAEQRRAGRITVRMRCGSVEGRPQWIELPVQAHRWLPADADVIGAKLSLTRVGADLRARLSVTARLPRAAVPRPPDLPTVAIHLGWHSIDDGIVVAHWRSDRPLAIAPELANVIVPITEDVSGRIVAPDSIATRLERHAEIASVRDVALDAIKRKVIAWLSEHGARLRPTYRGEEVTAADVAQWRSPAKFAALAVAWRETDLEIAESLEAWRRADKLLWQQQGHGRARALGYRDDLWRQVARALVNQCGRIVIDDTNISEVIRNTLDRSDLPNDLQQRIDRRRDYAAPGALRSSIVAAAERDAVPVTVVSAAGLSRIHAGCGYENALDRRPRQRLIVCGGCGRTYDPDLSATMLMLARGLDRS